jgi:hypothetical protein
MQVGIVGTLVEGRWEKSAARYSLLAMGPEAGMRRMIAAICMTT